MNNYVWANRQLNRSGRKFNFEFGENIFPDTALLSVLAQEIKLLQFEQ